MQALQRTLSIRRAPTSTSSLPSSRASQKPTPADLNAALKMSPSGINLLHIGDRFYAMGDYAKAAEIYRQTMGKAGVDPDLSNLHLGMALIRSGDQSRSDCCFQGGHGSTSRYCKAVAHLCAAIGSASQ